MADFYIIIKKVNGQIEGHAIRHGEIDKEIIEQIVFRADTEKRELSASAENAHSINDESADASPFPDTFQEVARSFSQAMHMYRKSILETIRFAPFFANLVLGLNVERLAKTRGVKREDLSSGDIHVHAVPSHAYSRVLRHMDRSDALIEGAQHLPKISTIGIISSYDAVLSDLLRVIFRKKPELIFTSDREVKLSDLAVFGSIEEVRDSILNNEVESIIRQSHHEQFLKMETKFSMKLRENLHIWPNFIELCERRNLLTHTGGVVSRQYLKNCADHGIKSDAKLGEKLEVDLTYLSDAINIVSEIGFKLIHTMWRKFAPEDRESADQSLNDVGMDLISTGDYRLAEVLLEFGVGQKTHSSDLLKRMMIVNLANAAKLGGNKDRCKKVLSSNDWSATSFKFQICVAAVRNDFEEVDRLLRLGSNVVEITSSDFRDWPVFHDARKDSKLQRAFEEVFNEPFMNENVELSFANSLAIESNEDDDLDGATASEDSKVH